MTSYRNIYAHVVYIAELVWLPVVSDRLFKCFLSTPVSATLFLHYRNDEDIGGILLWTPAQRSLSEVHVVLRMLFFIYFLWTPHVPAQVNGGSRNLYTWWTLSVNREVTTWIFSWS